MLQIRSFSHDKLAIPFWQLKHADVCAVLGRNGSGKQYINQLLVNDLRPPFQSQELSLPSPNTIALISHETILATYEHELKIDQTDITDEVDFGTPVCEFLPQDKLEHPLIDDFNFRHKMNTGFRLLSSGEGRKLFIIKALLEQKQLIILDNPFDELDIQSRLELSEQLSQINRLGVAIIFMLNNPNDTPKWVNHYLLLKDAQLTSLTHLSPKHLQQAIMDEFSQTSLNTGLLENQFIQTTHNQTHLVDIVDATVTFAQQAVFSNLSLSIAPYQHTLILGPNGCGKSTLLGLITGENPQCFSNQVTVVGYKRGSGESIWDVKKHLGIVSPDLHRNYRVNCSALTVVASGFNDSIGLYKAISGIQKQTAIDWLTLLNMAECIDKPWKALSYGEQRLVLIARALVKQPKLLILDEPTQGLDQANRSLVLFYLDKIAQLNTSTIVMVSHRADEHLALFKQTIRF